MKVRLVTPSPRTLVAITVCAAMIAAGGWWLRRGHGTDSADAATDPSNVAAAASSGSADGTAPGVAPTPPADVAEAALTVIAEGVGGPGDVELPLDPTRSRSIAGDFGARQSAIDYLSTVRQRLVYLSENSGREVLTDWAAPGVSPTVIDEELAQAGQIRTTLNTGDGPVWWVVAPLAARVEASDADRARVSVWLASLTATTFDSAQSTTAIQPTVRFQVDTVELVWTGRRWTVWSISSVEGPTPLIAPSLAPTTPDQFQTTLAGFSLVDRHS